MDVISRPLVYDREASVEVRNAVLCRAMRQTLVTYNELVEDLGRGKFEDEWETFVDFGTYDDYEVNEVLTPFNRAEYKVPADFTGLVVTHGYTAIAAVPTLGDGAELIWLASGRRVRLREVHMPSGRSWLPYPIDDGSGDAPVEPAPTGPVRRPVLT